MTYRVPQAQSMVFHVRDEKHRLSHLLIRMLSVLHSPLQNMSELKRSLVCSREIVEPAMSY